MAIAMAGLLTGCNNNEREYEKAVALFEGGQFEEAAAAFEALGDYEDAARRAALSWLEIEFHGQTHTRDSINYQLGYIEWVDDDNISIRILTTPDNPGNIFASVGILIISFTGASVDTPARGPIKCHNDFSKSFVTIKTEDGEGVIGVIYTFTATPNTKTRPRAFKLDFPASNFLTPRGSITFEVPEEKIKY
jgi:hypothetical protein